MTKKPAESSQETQSHPEFKYNNKTWKSYQDLLEKYKIENLTIPHGVTAPEGRKREFLARVDLEKGPIERKVTSMVRFIAKNREDKQPREYIKYYEDWQGKDWMDRKLRNSENLEGVYMEQEAEKIIRYNETTGPEVAGYRRSGEHSVFTIPYSKETVEKIIGDQDKSNIIYTVRTSERRQQFLFDEFVNYSWGQLEQILLLDGGADQARAERARQSGKVLTSNNLEFKPQ
jgi:hypothetical protein